MVGRSWSLASSVPTCRRRYVDVLARAVVWRSARSTDGAAAADQDLAGTNTDSATLETVGRSLEAVKEWTFALGPGFVVGIGNGLILGYLMYRSGLLPRGMAMLGLVGGSLICISGSAV